MHYVNKFCVFYIYEGIIIHSGGKKDEDKSGEENKPEDGNASDIHEETAKPSEDTPSMEPTIGSDQNAGSKDQVLNI